MGLYLKFRPNWWDRRWGWARVHFESSKCIMVFLFVVCQTSGTFRCLLQIWEIFRWLIDWFNWLIPFTEIDLHRQNSRNQNQAVRNQTLCNMRAQLSLKGAMHKLGYMRLYSFWFRVHVAYLRKEKQGLKFKCNSICLPFPIKENQRWSGLESTVSFHLKIFQEKPFDTSSFYNIGYWLRLHGTSIN